MSRTIKFRAWHRRYHVMRYEITNLDGWLSDSDCIVMQYTGLKDKNGKEIYEGDILDGMGVVKYETSSAEFLCEDSMGFSAIHKGADMEVIGNVYENPELLEK